MASRGKCCLARLQDWSILGLIDAEDKEIGVSTIYSL